MKKTSKILWGVLLVLAGVLLALKATDLLQFDIFFDGWWTLIIIIPSVIGLFTERNKTDNLIGIAVGVVGGILASLAYPIYNVIVKAKRKKLAPEIIRLADELMK